MNEEWKEIPGWFGKYLISQLGRLKSIKGKFSKKCPDGYITLGTIDTTGYYKVTLRRPGSFSPIRVHTLVAENFLPPSTITKNKCVNHKDGNKLNNHVDNLEWVTLGENVRHAVRTGLLNIKGENHPMAKLTSKQVLEIRRLRSERGLLHRELAQMFNIDRRQVGDIINRVNWGWLT